MERSGGRRTANTGFLGTVDEVGSDGAGSQEGPEGPGNLWEGRWSSVEKWWYEPEREAYRGGPLAQSEEGHCFLKGF